MSWRLTVTDLNDYVRRSLAGDPILQDVELRGEISNFKCHVTGHYYFSLKDEQSRIQCVMFRQNTLGMSFRPEDGMRVVLRGSVSVYVASGSYQFYAVHMTQEGLGELHLRFEALKKRLLAEGLFDAAKKRPLPLLPRMVGIVTARTGAVIHDIARVAGRRNPSVQLLLRPAKVQGEGAAEDVAQGIYELSQVPNVDVIIIGRGGGSIEDLWAFNEEIVVRAIDACPVPIISAVGHEVDVTLSDFAADVRAATPSAAAELAVQERSVLQNTVGEMEARVFKAAYDAVVTRRAALNALEKRLALCHPLALLQKMKAENALCRKRLDAAADKQLAALKARVPALSDRLKALGPVAVLERGYAVVLADGEAITEIAKVQPDMTLLLKDGRVRVHTVSAERGDPFEQQYDL